MNGTDMERRKYFTYILRCHDGTFYTGYTVDDVEKRVETHNAGKGAKYTRNRLPVELVWYHIWQTEHEARSYEYRIKTWTRKQKEALVRGEIEIEG